MIFISVPIGGCNYFGFGFTTVNRKLFYYDVGGSVTGKSDFCGSDYISSDFMTQLYDYDMIR